MKANPGVGVLCDEESHSDCVAKGAEFNRNMSGSWSVVPPYRPDAASDWVLWSDKPRVGTLLHGNSPESDPADMDGGRLRYRLECGLCGLNVPARAETLHSLLDKLAEAGVSIVKLAVLARVLF